MSQLKVRRNRHLVKWSFIAAVAGGLVVPVSISCLHQTRAHAQGRMKKPYTPPVIESDETPAPFASKGVDSRGPMLSPMDPALQRVATINSIEADKRRFRDATAAKISERLQVMTQCQNNLDALTAAVSNDGLSNLEQRIRQTRPQICNLKRCIADNRHEIGLLAITEDNLERRILQLEHQEVYELQPDPTRLLALKRQLENGTNRILSNIDRDDPQPGLELNRVAALRAQLEPEIEGEETKLLNRAADQQVAAKKLEEDEYERYRHQQDTDLVAQLRNEAQTAQAH